MIILNRILFKEFNNLATALWLDEIFYVHHHHVILLTAKNSRLAFRQTPCSMQLLHTALLQVVSVLTLFIIDFLHTS